MWYPYLALAAAFVPLLIMGIGYLIMGRRSGGDARPDEESRS